MMLEKTEAYGLTFTYPAGDLAVGRCLRDYGEFAWPGVELVAQMSVGGSFVDVGANIGSFALPVARKARRVIAVEAHPGLADILAENVKLNGLTNIEIVAAAAGAKQGSVQFPVVPLDGQRNYGILGVGVGREHLETVPLVALDALVPDDTKFIKVDVEGYESDVLAGAVDTLRRVRPAWLVETATETAENQAVIATFLREGYRLYWFWTPFVTPLAPKSRWRGKYLGDLNVLAVPRERPQPQGMVEVMAETTWPTSISGFTYLTVFGWRADQLA